MKQTKSKKEESRKGKIANLTTLKKEELQNICGGATYELVCIEGVYQLVRVS